MIDAVDVIFIEAAGDVGIEGARRGEVVSEGLFDDEARPASSGGMMIMTGEFGIT